jgi:hypothetical protein
MAERRWLNYLAAYIGWAVCIILAIWTLLVWRNAFSAAISIFFIKGSDWRAIQSGFYDKVFLIIIGLLWLYFMIISEQYVRKGAAKRRLVKSLAWIFGLVITITFVGDFFLFILIGTNPLSWFRLLILVVELALGVGLLYLAINYQKVVPKVKEPDVH